MTETIPEIADDLFAQATLIRTVELRLLDLFSEGKLSGTVHTCIGQEFTGIAVCSFLGNDDLIFSNHRCHGHFLARTGDVDGLVAEVMGKESGVCGGRGGSQHLCSSGFFSNGVQGSIVPVAAGLALAKKRDGVGGVVVAFIGDGTLGEGVLYETLNIASKWQLPLLIVLEDNGYAQSTPQKQYISGEIPLRARAFGIETGTTDTWDLEGLFNDSRKAVEFVRLEARPYFLKIRYVSPYGALEGR